MPSKAIVHIICFSTSGTLLLLKINIPLLFTKKQISSKPQRLGRQDTVLFGRALFCFCWPGMKWQYFEQQNDPICNIL